jgi:amino acid adenylation domain-containing protein
LSVQGDRMRTVQLLKQLQNLGIKVWAEGDRLRVRSSTGLSDEIRRELQERRPELLALFAQVSQPGDSSPALVRVGRSAPIAPTYAQQRLWFLDQFQPGVPNYNLSDRIEIKHEIDIAALQRAVTELVRRHEVLRTSFPAVNGVPMQLIAPAAQVALPVLDLSGLPEAERMAEVRRLALEESRKPFNLATGPLLRVALIRVRAAHYFWLLTIHHIISDEWSKRIIDEELETLYAAFSAGLASPLPELSIQWADFAAWQTRCLRDERLDRNVQFWTEQLQGELPVLQLPRDRPRRLPARGRGAKFSFLPALSRALRELSKTEGATLFMVLLAGYAITLSRYTHQEDIVVGSAVSDRSRVETEAMIGFLLNMLPLRIRVDPQSTFRELLQQVRRTCLGAYAHQDFPYESLMQHSAVEWVATGDSLFRTMLVLHNTPPPSVRRGSLGFWDPHEDSDRTPAAGSLFGTYEEDDTNNGTTRFDMEIIFSERGNGIRGKIEYDADIFTGDAAERLLQRLQMLLRSAAATPDCKVAELEWMTEQERQLLKSWSFGPRRVLDVTLLHQLFERSTRLYPVAIAVEEGDGQSITYADLNARSNQIAVLLREMGAGPESSVGILFERSIDMFAAVLAVLKAGAAYVPLDTSFPEERLNFMIEDARVDYLVTLQPTLGALPAFGGRALCLDRDGAQIASADTSNANYPMSPDSLACVLYPSRSAARPRGVMLTHRGLAGYIDDATRAYGLSRADRILQFASTGLDASLEESLLAFGTGAALVLPPERMLDSTSAFVERCKELRLTSLVLPIGYWQEWVAKLETFDLPPHLRRVIVIVGGERVAPDKLAKWHRHINGKIQLFNTYVPTEGSIAATCSLMVATPSDESFDAAVSIGKPVANCAVHVLDQRMQPVPCGVPGEVYVAGLPVARGYFGNVALTAERFIADPSNSEHGARLYRTGDLARFLPDGTLQWQGRIDSPVKIRGHYIELREIEVILEEHTGVKGAVVVIREDEPGDKRLVAYVVPVEGSALDAAQLRVYLRSKLPSYMAPAAFVLLPAFPVTISGKVNKRALPAPNVARNDKVPVIRVTFLQKPRENVRRING